MSENEEEIGPGSAAQFMQCPSPIPFQLQDPDARLMVKPPVRCRIWAGEKSREAKELERQGNHEAAERARVEAEEWERLEEAGPVIPRGSRPMDLEMARELAEIHGGVERSLKVILGRAASCPDSSAEIGVATGMGGEVLSGLTGLAAEGDPDAAVGVLNVLEAAVEDFERLCDLQPAIMKQLLSARHRMPGLLSQRPEDEKANKERLNKLEVGKESAIKATVEKGKGPKTVRSPYAMNAQRLAKRLLGYMEGQRVFYLLWRSLRDKIGNDADLGPIDYPEDWIEHLIALPECSEKTWRQWAQVAWMIVVSRSRKRSPYCEDLFFEPETEICNVRAEKIDHELGEGKTYGGKGVAENDIKEALLGAIERVVTGRSSKTRQRTQRVTRQKS